MKNLADFLVGRKSRKEPEETLPPPSPPTCPTCGADLSTSELYHRLRVCHGCRRHFRLSARQRIDLLADEGTFKEVNRLLTSVDPLSFTDKVSYRKRLEEAQRRTGLTEAVVTGTCRVEGKSTVLVAMDFEFMGGTMGSVVGEKVTMAFELAVKEKQPIIVVATGGGARMQEGMLSLMQMAKTAAAAQRLHRAGLPYISVLTDPTTGGIYASFASLGDVIVAEPGALVGFAGPRVVRQTTGEVDAVSHTSEFLFQHGMVDLIVDRARLRTLLSVLLHLLNPQFRLVLGRKVPSYPTSHQVVESAWDAVQLARHQQRPTAMDYIGRMMSNFVELHGDRLYGDDEAVVCGLADLSGQPVVVIGQERGHGEPSRNEGRARPEGYRKAQRAMGLAAKFGLPLITFIDTPGADPGLESEERGIATTLATTLALMSQLPVPMLTVVIGEGGSGGALALGVADRILMLEHAIYSVISPEGAAAILYRDAARAEEVAPALKLTAQDCLSLGVVDLVVPEPEGGAHADPEAAAWQLKNVLLQELVALQSHSLPRLLKARYEKYRRVGQFNSYFKAAVGREVNELQGYLHRGWEHLRDRLPHRSDARTTDGG
ncbi:MAG: acetyl-CoA carboxylase carboxyl transferase subunit alpha [Dehalococcoidia bacterium]|nr:acetyl-CoA carboxylase carboxyl transferase subunit alpha [Dehalococcoidia bacterium]